MPNLLRPKLRAELVEALTHALPQVAVIHGKYLEPSTVGALYDVDQMLPKDGPVRQKLVSYINDMPLYQFLLVQIPDRLEGQYVSEPDKTPLTGFSQFDDPASAAAALIEEFDSLPWTYTLTFGLPASFGATFGSRLESFEVAKGMRLCMGRKLLAEQLPWPRAFDGLLFGISSSGYPISETDVYLQVDIHGFVAEFVRTELVESAIGTLRAVCGLLMVLRMIVVNRQPSVQERFSQFPVHRVWPDGRQELMHAEALDRRYVEALSYFAPAPLTLTHLETGLASALARLRTIFNQTERSSRIRLAAQWHFDSHVGSDELLQYVQATIVLEILLGDKERSDKAGLVEILRNRCAFLIARSQAERDHVLELFPKIYDVRSKIVHSGKSRLSGEDQFLFDRLRLLCARVIAAEIMLLEKDAARDAIESGGES